MTSPSDPWRDGPPDEEPGEADLDRQFAKLPDGYVPLMLPNEEPPIVLTEEE